MCVCGGGGGHSVRSGDNRLKNCARHARGASAPPWGLMAPPAPSARPTMSPPHQFPEGLVARQETQLTPEPVRETGRCSQQLVHDGTAAGCTGSARQLQGDLRCGQPMGRWSGHGLPGRAGQGGGTEGTEGTEQGWGGTDEGGDDRHTLSLSEFLLQTCPPKSSTKGLWWWKSWGKLGQ